MTVSSLSDKVVFDVDEQSLRKVDPNWNAKELLDKEAVFFLKDVVKILDLDPVKVKKRAKRIEDKGKNPWVVMGARRVWTHWIVRMKVFGPYYNKYLTRKVLPVNPEWDGNMMLQQKGTFLLTDVCKRLPFTSHQIRYQAKKSRDSRRDYGMWKEKELNAFVVDMEKFAPWIKRLWSGDFSN